jgi:hypothetical protein
MVDHGRRGESGLSIVMICFDCLDIIDWICQCKQSFARKRVCRNQRLYISIRMGTVLIAKVHTYRATSWYLRVRASLASNEPIMSGM